MKSQSPLTIVRLAGLTAALSLSLLTAFGGPGKGSGADNFPRIQLPAVSRGQTAVNALGAQLPAVARAYGLQANQLRVILQGDQTLAVDPAGRLHYTDAGPDAGATAEGTAAGTTTTLADTFYLHSRPGAKRIVYLDFNGHLLSGTAWNQGYNAGNDIVAPPFDTDGNPGTFSDAELTVIQQVWQRVAEDYAPFDVDVTTELTNEGQITRSSSSDEYYGTRVLISPISQYFGNYGGFAYIGAFDDVGDYYKPALAFSDKLLNSEKYIAEACSHEAGHNLGLTHDGTTGGAAYYAGHGSGETGWAPIMGNGYYQNVTQWSRGEYSGANNLQDDLAVITSYGAPYRPDDHGNAAASASYFPAGTQLSATGVIERNTDVDVFAFTTGAGTVSFSINPVGLGPNLDVAAELRDAAGTLLASANPASLLASSLSLSLPGGTYFLHLRGSGSGDPLNTGYSAYASLGQYAVAGTVVDATGTLAPVAVAATTSVTGNTPLAVTFDGGGSFDQDGTIVNYAWNFGDGTTASGVSVNKTYNAAGTYTASLTVTDNQGFTGTDSVTLQAIAPNIPPNAVATASATTGPAPLGITFDGSGSGDPDGSIAAYSWNFGDGTTATGATVAKTYGSPGTFNASLTVTDNRGATATTTIVIQVSADPAKIIRVQAIALGITTAKNGKSVRATVKVTDLDGTAVAGVRVNGTWSGLVSGTASATTDTAGNAVITSKSFRNGGTVTFTVTGLTKSGLTYTGAENLQTSASISAAK